MGRYNNFDPISPYALTIGYRRIKEWATNSCTVRCVEKYDPAGVFQRKECTIEDVFSHFTKERVPIESAYRTIQHLVNPVVTETLERIVVNLDNVEQFEEIAYDEWRKHVK